MARVSRDPSKTIHEIAGRSEFDPENLSASFKAGGVSQILTVTNRELLFKTEDEYRTVNRGGLAQGFILEPFGRNTAAAVAMAALQIKELKGTEAHMLVLAADHLIQDEEAFSAAVSNAVILSEKDGSSHSAYSPAIRRRGSAT